MMEEFGFEDDLFEEKKKAVVNPDDQIYVARIEEPLVFIFSFSLFTLFYFFSTQFPLSSLSLLSPLLF